MFVGLFAGLLIGTSFGVGLMAALVAARDASPAEEARLLDELAARRGARGERGYERPRITGRLIPGGGWTALAPRRAMGGR